MARTRNLGGAAQLKDYLRASFYLGKLSSGDKIPSHRELARGLRISPTTALQLYDVLEDEGILQSRERSGTFLRQVGMAAEKRPEQCAVFKLIQATASRLHATQGEPKEFTSMLLRYVGAEIRPDFKFGFLMHREAFEIAVATVQHKRQLHIPMLQLPPDGPNADSARAILGRDPHVRCIIATYLHIELATDLAREFDRQVIMARPDESAGFVFELTESQTRFVLTRDRDTASDLLRLVDKVFGSAASDRFVIASLVDDAQLKRMESADEILITPTVHSFARARFGPAKIFRAIPSNVSDDTLDEMLFQYLFG